MPSIWSDVRFDAAATDHVKEKLIATARALGEATAVLMEDIPVVTDDWRGRFREVFDPEAVRLLGTLAMVAEALLGTAVELVARLEDAEAEQARRLRLRTEAYEAQASQPASPRGPR